ncbi:MAG TPA: ABC transporter ATP-binding protein [Clostridia bacterium]|nr:ABC transporter ATP-binding protein [Clostridia bacterium]
MSNIIQLKQITKSFGSVLANDAIDLNIEEGQVHALLGENGSGKSTLMNILFGFVKPDAGEIYVKGERVQIRSPLDAIRHGIGMIHQEFMLVPDLSVQENLMLGLLEKDRSSGLNDIFAKKEDYIGRFELRSKLHRPIRELSVGERQKVEIVKTLYQGAEVIILDEPTSVLTPQEAVRMFDTLNNLVLLGKTVILITHKLDEVFKNSSEVTVLRGGKKIDTLRTEDTDRYTLAEKMVGRKLLFTLREKQSAPGEPLVVVEHLSYTNRAERKKKVDDVSLTIRNGEILGLAGVDGNGQMELSELLAGVRKPDLGTYTIAGKPVKRFQVRALSRLGVSFIPGERNNYGCIADLSIEQNLVLKEYHLPSFSEGGLLKRTAIRAHAERLIRQYQIKAPNGTLRAGSLSGGNLQKVILARELSNAPKFLICVQPTRGLDIGAVEYVQNALLEAREAGVGILLISTELDEILALSDRIAVISDGKIADILENDAAIDIGNIGLLMGGDQAEERTVEGGEGI